MSHSDACVTEVTGGTNCGYLIHFVDNVVNVVVVIVVVIVV